MKAATRAAFLVVTLYATTALARPVPLSDNQLNQIVAGEDFTIVNEVSDLAALNPTTVDPRLVNPWGLSQPPGGPLWVANNGTGTSTIYNFSTFAKIPLNVTIPGAGGAQGTPTGTTFTNTDKNTFRVSENGVTGHSVFLFDAQDGTISGWSPTVDLHNAIIAVDLSDTGASFFGLTLKDLGSASQLYAADFGNKRVDVFNNQFQLVGSFTDPSLPDDYAPFNVQTLGDKVYVAYAQREEDEAEEVTGAGLGYIVVFDTAGHKLKTLVSAGGALNAPWGMTIAPSSFGQFAGKLLVGNFGDGKINVYDPDSGALLGTLSDHNVPLAIEGLWALRPGPDGSVVFSAGIEDETHGLVGVIRPSWSQASWAYQSHVSLPGH
jgi:uncharacterized protein (TIGR03118 family)